MDINSSNIEEIVRQVLGEMKGVAPAASTAGGNIPSTAHVAMLTQLVAGIVALAWMAPTSSSGITLA